MADLVISDGDSFPNIDPVDLQDPDLSENNDIGSDDEVSGDESLRDMFLNNLALFDLKLNTKYHMPASTVQMVIQELQSIHDISQNCLKDHFKRKITEISVLIIDGSSTTKTTLDMWLQ